MNITNPLAQQYWTDAGDRILLHPPKEFNYNEILVFLNRTNNEILHTIEGTVLRKAIRLHGDKLLIEITEPTPEGLPVRCLNETLDSATKAELARYIWELFDLDIDLHPFYQMAKGDHILGQMVQDYYGLRIINFPDLYEVISWAIMGQQINIHFAYTLKANFVRAFGESIDYEGQQYWLFPEPETVVGRPVEELRELKFTGRKSEYLIGVAQQMVEGNLTLEKLLQLQTLAEMERELIKVKGIGSWTANYVLMKCTRHPEAFPIQDVGIHNAIKAALNLPEKPTINEVREIAKSWQGHERYATFYLWRSLYKG